MVAGTNADKIPGSAIANPVSLGTVNASALAVSGTTTLSGVLTANASGNQVGGNLAVVNNGVNSGDLTVAGTSTLHAVSGTTGTFSGQVQSNGVNVRRITGGTVGGVVVPANGSAAFSVTLDDAITPTRAVATVFGSNGAVIYNAQITSIGAGTVSGIVDCNSTGGTVAVHVIAY